MPNINQEIKDLEATLVSLKAKAKAKAQEPTLTPVSFESKGELAKALIDGRTFKTPSGNTLVYDEETRFSAPFRLMKDRENSETMTGVWNLYWNLEEINAASEEPWYLNIPKGGIKCYVSDDEPNPSAESGVIRVVEYDTRNRLSFRSRGIGWKYATPVNGAR
tara:strand:+ start:45 stop:533 length:489 start_codon:yes stop_codon:yes gene_type:complete